MTLLQVFADDSVAQSGDQKLFFAGYINTAESWAAFADAWGAALKEAPAVPYLRTVEANALRGAFRGWTAAQRDAKLARLAYVIGSFRPISFQFSVSRRDYSALIPSVAPRGVANPYFPVIFHVVSGIARQVHGMGIRAKIEFIFDEQAGVSDDIDLFFDYMVSNLPVDVRDLIHGFPAFRNDRLIKPLQAADMLAWHLRREHEHGAGGRTPALLRQPAHLSAVIDRARLEKWAEAFAALPAAGLLSSKAEWQTVKQLIRRLKAHGHEPPLDLPESLSVRFAGQFKRLLRGKQLGD